MKRSGFGFTDPSRIRPVYISLSSAFAKARVSAIALTSLSRISLAMSSKDEARIFVGGLSFETSDRKLEDVFRRFGKVLEAQVMLDRDTGRPRGFGFVTFADRRAMEDAIAEMHGQELNGRTISVNKAEPRMGSDDPGHDYRGGDRYSSGGRGGGYHGGGGRDRPLPAGSSDCFKCGRPGHWARECPSAGGDSDRSRFSSRTSRFGGGGGGGRGDRFGGGDRYGGDRYIDDRYDGGRYGDRERERDRVDSKDDRYGGGGRDRYVSDRSDRYGTDRHPPSGGDRYNGGGMDRYPQNGYGKERTYDRDGPRGGPTRYESGGGYRERPGPYDRPARGGRPSSYDR